MELPTLRSPADTAREIARQMREIEDPTPQALERFALSLDVLAERLSDDDEPTLVKRARRSGICCAPAEGPNGPLVICIYPVDHDCPHSWEDERPHRRGP